MKKLVAGSVLAIVALAGSGVSAHEDGNEKIARAEVRAAVKTENEVRKAENKITVETRKADKQVRKEEQRKETVQKFWNKMEKRLGVLIRNQERLAVRIEKRIIKMKEDGRNVAAAEAQLVEARKAIAEAKDALAKGDAAVEKLLAANDAKAALEKVKAVNKDILEKIKASHKALVTVLTLLKGPKPTPTPSGTVSPSPSATPSPTNS